MCGPVLGIDHSEIWKDAPGYEGLYAVSNLGRIKSLSRTITRVLYGREITQRLSGRVLKPNTNRKGYQYVILRRDGRSHTQEVHRIVAKAFLKEPSQGQCQVRHLDGDRLNNTTANLAWGSASQNQLDLYDYRGYHHRLTPEDARDIRARLAGGETGRSLAKEYGVRETTISSIKHRRHFAWLT